MRNIPSAFTVLEFCGASVFTIPFNIVQASDFGLSRRAPFGYVKQCGSGTMGYWHTVETSIFVGMIEKVTPQIDLAFLWLLLV